MVAVAVRSAYTNSQLKPYSQKREAWHENGAGSQAKMECAMRRQRLVGYLNEPTVEENDVCNIKLYASSIDTWVLYFLWGLGGRTGERRSGWLPKEGTRTFSTPEKTCDELISCLRGGPSKRASPTVYPSGAGRMAHRRRGLGRPHGTCGTREVWKRDDVSILFYY